MTLLLDEKCVALTAQATGVSREDVREIVEEVVREHDRLKKKARAEGRDFNAQKELAEAINRKAGDMEKAVVQHKQHAALNVIRRTELDARIGTFERATGDTREALRSVLVGSHKRVEGARLSVDAQHQALLGEWVGGMAHELDALPGVAKRLRRDKRFLDDVVREMHEVHEGGRPGVSGDEQARAVADIFARYAEGARVRLNEAGAMIGKLPGWVPQSHDAGKIRKAGFEAWRDTILPLLDMDRSFGDMGEEGVQELLEEIHDNIITGRNRAVSAGERGRRLGPRNLARSMGKHRVLHFKDADAWIKYHDRFGNGNVFTGVTHHMEHAARRLALMETLGPNPESMLISLVENAKRRIRVNPNMDAAAKAKALDRLSGDISQRGGVLGQDLAEVLGETLVAENVTAARISSMVRMQQSLAKLGGAALSAISDLLTVGMNARVNGMNLFGSYAQSFDALLTGYGNTAKTDVAHSLGMLYDGMLGDIAQRWNAQDSLTGKAAQIQNWFFKYSGLTPWTERLKAGYARMLSNHYARRVEFDFAGLPERERAVLGYHGITATEWEVMRHMTRRAADGHRYLLPDAARTVPGEIMDSLVTTTAKNAEQAKFLRRKAAERLESKVRAFVSDETQYAVLEPDARTRRLMVQGTRPGTIKGELLRFVTQFKSFPVAYTQRIIGGRRFQAPGRGMDLPGITHFVAGSLVLGYAAAAAKAAAKGRTPPDPDKLETWFAAAVQSGGAGIYGDFLLAKYNRFGGGPISTAAGPAAGALGELIQMGSGALRGETRAGDALYFAMNNAPFINLWWTRAALDYGILYHLQEMASPGTLRRRERRMKSESNQTFILPPSKTIKRGGGYR